MRNFGHVRLDSGMHIWSLFYADAQLWGCYARLWDAYFVAAPLWACHARLWNAHFVSISRTVDAPLRVCYARLCHSEMANALHMTFKNTCVFSSWPGEADFVAISRRCATLAMLYETLEYIFCRDFT